MYKSKLVGPICSQHCLPICEPGSPKLLFSSNRIHQNFVAFSLEMWYIFYYICTQHFFLFPSLFLFPSFFIFLGANVNNTVFYISYYACSFMAYGIGQGWSLYIKTLSCKFAKLLIIFMRVFVYSWSFYPTNSSCTKSIFNLSFSIYIHSIYFTCIIEFPSTFCTMLKRRSEREHTCLALGLSVKASSFPPLTINSAIGHL